MLLAALILIADPSSLPSSLASSSSSDQVRQPASEEASSAPLQLTPPTLAPPRNLVKPAAFVFLAGAGAAMVSVPVSLVLGTAIGSLSSSLAGALVPSLILLAAIPPIAITVAAYLVAQHFFPDAARFSPAIFVAIGLQLIGVLSAVFAGVSSVNPASVVAFTAVEAVVIPAGVALTMGLGWRAHIGASSMAVTF